MTLSLSQPMNDALDLNPDLMRHEGRTVHDREIGATLDALTHAVVNAINSISTASELARLLIMQQAMEDAAEPLSHIESGCMYAAQLLRAGHEFMTFRVSPSRDRVDLPALVGACTDSFPGRVEIRIDQPLPPVTGDTEALRRACMEILVNAFQFGANRVHVTLTAAPSGDAVQIGFEDDGPGVPEPGPRLFEPFYTTLRGDHCGLGLALTSRIMRAHGGSVGVKAQTQGATFWITVPARGN